MNQIDPNFDWVSARAACTPEQAFELLRNQVKADVERRMELRSPKELQFQVTFGFEESKKAFKVSRISDFSILENATFSFTEDGISVQYAPKMNIRSIDSTSTLSNEGECKLKVSNDEEYFFWQFRKMALERILFSAGQIGF